MNETRRLAIYGLAGLILAATAIVTVNFSLPSLQAHVGTLDLLVKDAPPSGSNTTVTKLYLTIDQIMVHRETNDTGSWVNVSIPSTTIELLSLRNLSENFPQLAAAKLPSGTYNLIWLRVTNATAIVKGAFWQLRVPSGMIKIPEIRFTVSDGGVTNILIDIGYQSVHLNHELMLSPVAHILSQSHP
jgi:uncharacterized protein DUF4382